MLGRLAALGATLAAGLVAGAGASAVVGADGVQPLWAVLGVVAGLAGLLGVSRQVGPLGGALLGATWGLVYYAVHYRWSLDLHPVAWVALVPVQALFVAVPAAVAAAARRAGPWSWVGATTAAWVLVDAVRARTPLGGFEWGQLAITTAGTPLAAPAAVVGAIGLSGLLAAVACSVVIVGATGARGIGSWAPLGAVLGGALVLGALGAVGWTEAREDPVDLLIVQIDPVCPDVFSVECPNYSQRVMDAHVSATEAWLEAATEVDDVVLVWGEGALRATDPDAAGRFVAGVDWGVPFLSGASTDEAPDGFRQSAMLFDGDGDLAGVYDKRQGVPFGEFVPFRSALGGIADVGRRVPRDIVPGERAVPLAMADGRATFGSVVSWEITFARLVRDAARDADIVVTVTTQESYGISTVSEQLIALSQLRAAEVGKPVVVAAVTGRSAVIPAGGGPTSVSPLFAGGDLDATVVPHEGTTPYAAVGDALAIGMALAVGLVAAIGCGRAGRNASPGGDG